MRTVTENGRLQIDDKIVIFDSSTDFVFSLTEAVNTEREVTMINKGSGNVYVTSVTSELISNYYKRVLAPYDILSVVETPDGWLVRTFNKPNIIHGSMFCECVAYEPVLTEDEWILLEPGMTVNEAHGVVLVNDSIIIPTPGDYMMHMSCTLSGSNGNDFRIKAFVNDANTLNGSNHITTTGANNYSDLSYFWYAVGLSPGDVITLKIMNTTNSNSPTITDIKMSIEHKD